MIRVVTVIVVLWVALAQPVAAQIRVPSSPETPLGSSANPAMCGDNAQLATLEDLFTGRLAEPGGWQWQSKSEDGQQPAWCISPDDPRCAPRDAGAPLYSQRASAPACGIDGMNLVTLRAMALSSAHPPVQLSAPRHGVRSSVERPPRARSAA